MPVGSRHPVQLIVPQTQPLERRDHVQGADKEAEFLSLRLLNKRARVRLSPRGIDYSRLPGNASLFAVGNIKGWFAAVICGEDNGQYILMSTLADLRTAFESGQADPEPFIPFHANHTELHSHGTPAFLKFALNDDCLIICYLEGPISVYSSKDVLRSNPSSQPSPILTFSGDASTPRQILPNPGDSPELVAIVRWSKDPNPEHQIDIIDVKNLKNVETWRGGVDPKVSPVSISWSPKGKQIAIGLESGDILLYSPHSPENPKSHLFKVPSTPADVTCLLSINWLSNSTFHTVHSSPEASSPLFDPSLSDPPNLLHFVSSHDSKARFAVDVELRDPCPPFGTRRPPGLLSVVLRNWNPTKFLIFCGGGASSDIGVIGSFHSDDASRSDGQWVNINLEETSTPSLPLDEELNELALLGLNVDLTSSKPIRMSEQSDDGTPDLPPSPILYAYANDGTLIAWHIINTNGEAYPGMSTGGTVGSTTQGSIQHRDSTKSVEMTALPLIPEQSPSTLNQTPSPLSKPSNLGFGAYANANTSANFASGIGFGGTPATPALRQRDAVPAFGSGEVSATGGNKVAQTTPQPPAPTFGTTGFGNATTVPTFGTSSFGSRPTAPVFGQSGFGSTTSAVPKFTSTGGGFASFATQGNSTFGAPVDTTPVSQPTSAFGNGGVGKASSVTRGAFGQQTSQSFSTFGGFEQATSSFGVSTSSSPRITGGLTGSGASGNLLEPKQTRAEVTSFPGSPPSPTASLPDSPVLGPAAQPSKPTSSYLKPAAGFGSLNKPSQGFGTFSGTGTSSTPISSNSAESNAFSLQKTVTEQPKTTTPSTAPVFGATSALGQHKPVFGTSSFGSMPQPTANASKPITGGFGAFSSGGGGFASFATAGKVTSFADMLRSDNTDKAKRDSKTLVFGSSPSTTGKAQPSGTPSQHDISSAPVETPVKTYSTRMARDKVNESDEEEEVGKERFSEEKLTSQEPSVAGAKEQDASLSLLSLGEITSEVSELLKDTSQEKDATDAKLFEKEGKTTSEPILLTEERLGVSGVDDVERHSSSSPSPEGESPQDSPLSTDNLPRKVDKESTTPTGSPIKSVTTASRKPLAAVVPSTTTLPQGVGLGLPSSRPLRSSPLASTPIMNAGNDSPKPDIIPAKSVPQTEEIPQHPMQAEFLRLYDEVTEGLVQLYRAIQETIVIRPIISEPRGLEKLLVNNQKFVPGQYSHGDLKAFTKMIGILHESVVPLLKLGGSKRLALRYLENLALITETKQEEVELWVHAHQDPSFADTLKPHTLSPEHSEHQIRLRKAVQVAKDRVQQCEDMMEFLKRRLEHHRSGKIGLRPPSLDIIDRTCQNIQTALEQRVTLLEQLHDRIEKLSPKDSRRLQASQTRASSPVPTPAPVTPPFASIAAAALNSERSSMKLKATLLSARKEPLLTTNVSKMQHPTGVEPNQPQIHEQKLPSYVTPPDSSQMTSPMARRSGRPGKRHGAVQLKEGLSETSPKSVVFDWGPLPGVSPMSILSSDVRNSRGA